jgi:hypothetical protein
MDIGENLSDAIRYPFNDWVKIIILGIISIIPIVDFVSLGYYLRIIQSTLVGIDELPEFDDFGGLFINGLKVFIANIVYFIVPIIFYILAYSFAVSTTYGGIYVPAFVGIAAVFLILFIISLILAYLLFLPALVNMAIYDAELGAAFRFSEIIDRIRQIGWADYIIWIIVMIVVTVVLGVIIGLIGSILLIILIGFLVWIFGFTYIYMFVIRSLALLFAGTE